MFAVPRVLPCEERLSPSSFVAEQAAAILEGPALAAAVASAVLPSRTLTRFVVGLATALAAAAVAAAAVYAAVAAADATCAVSAMPAEAGAAAADVDASAAAAEMEASAVA